MQCSAISIVSMTVADVYVYARVNYVTDRWKCGHLVPNWTFRRFELRQNGTLAYYKGHKLKGKIRLRGCNVIPTEEFDFQVIIHTLSYRVLQRYGVSLLLSVTCCADSEAKRLHFVVAHIGRGDEDPVDGRHCFLR